MGLVSGDGVETETMLISEEIAMSPGGQEELSSEEADAVDLVGEAWGSVMAEEGGLVAPEVVPGQAGVVPVLGDDAVEVVFGEAVAVLDAARRMAMGQPDVRQGGEVEDAGDARAARDEREASVLRQMDVPDGHTRLREAGDGAERAVRQDVQQLQHPEVAGDVQAVASATDVMDAAEWEGLAKREVAAVEEQEPVVGGGDPEAVAVGPELTDVVSREDAPMMRKRPRRTRAQRAVHGGSLVGECLAPRRGTVGEGALAKPESRAESGDEGDAAGGEGDAGDAVGEASW